MKEKIIKILESQFSVVEYEDPDTGFTESTTIDVLTTDEFPDIVDKLEILINQEVEKRIAERMPSRDCENRELDRRKRYDEAMGYNEIKALEKGIKFGMRFYKRLLTNSSQKTEGGGE